MKKNNKKESVRSGRGVCQVRPQCVQGKSSSNIYPAAARTWQPKFFIKTFGCQMNLRDTEVICGLLAKAGYKLVDSPEKADVVIFNTCSVRQHAEDKVWSEIGRVVKMCPPRFADANLSRGTTSPNKKIIGLVGCIAQNYKDEVFKRSAAVDFVVGPSDIHKIPEIIKKIASSPACGEAPRNDTLLFTRKIWETEGEIRPDEVYHTGFYDDKEHAFVVISEGCSNYCSYCVVPYVRGELHHRDYMAVLKEIEEAIDRGITRITLLGQNVNAYGLPVRRLAGTPVNENSIKIASSPTGRLRFVTLSSSARNDTQKTVDFIKLLELVNQVPGLKEFSFITSHPKDTSVELFKAMARLDKLKKYLHLPVQAGSDRILKLMNRNYTRKFYLDLADNYRKIVKGGVLTTDIILGFPTETEEDFKDTYNLVKDIGFDAAFIFKYSVRPHTEAANMVDDVPKEEKERRHGLILELQKEISRKKNARVTKR